MRILSGIVEISNFKSILLPVNLEAAPLGSNRLQLQQKARSSSQSGPDLHLVILPVVPVVSLSHSNRFTEARAWECKRG